MNKNFSNMIMETLSKLTKETDSYGNYLHMQISFPNDYRMYICLSPFLSDHIIVHTEYDFKPSLDENIVMSKKSFKNYIETYPNPEYIGIRTDHELEELTVIHSDFKPDW